jgi:hypothetical protein
MKHLLDRNDFLTQSRMNEGIIGDTFRKGVKKLKDMFSLLYKKVKNFIAIFDSKGNVLPVVSLQACVDHFAGVKGVEVVTSKEINDSIKKVGGQTGGTTISLSNDNESYEDVDKDSVEYKNLMSIPKILKESFGGEQLDERISYSEAGEGLNIPTIDIEEFKEKILGRIVDRQKKKRKGNMLIFGAPGIGKSSIANSVKEAYNRSKSNEQGISIITINCADLAPGDFLMPTMAEMKDIKGDIEARKEAPEFASIDGWSEEQKNQLETVLSRQKVSNSAPKNWFPCYLPSGNAEIDVLLDAAANGCVNIDTNHPENNKRTGSGGILLLDEYFRANPMIFSQLMTLLLERKMGDWVLGSKWAIIACSNRPADSKTVTEVFESRIEGADLDRYADIALLSPDVNSWKDYMRSKGLTGENEIIFKFIFDPDSMEGDEYPRWHSVDNKDDAYGDDEKNTLPVTPRRCEKVWGEIEDYLDAHDLDSVIQIPLKKLSSLLKTMFTPDFLHEFIDWIEQHTGNVNLDDIVKDPTNVFPRKDVKTDDVIIVRDLGEQFEKKYGKDKDCPDEELANLMTWFGLHMKDNPNVIMSDFMEWIDKVLPNASDNALHTKEKTVNVMLAAWPDSDDFEGVDESRVNDIKELMKEYFPWRLDGDKIKFINDYA